MLIRQVDPVCNITYPEGPTKNPDASGSSSDEFINASEDKNRPVVVLLGWTECRDKELAKFSAIFENSCITLRCTIPGIYVTYGGNYLLEASRHVFQLIIDKRFDEHPIFFIVFSNGGAIFYQQISLTMQKAGSPLKVKGVIFDSCPGDKSVLSAYKAVRVIFSRHSLGLPLSLMYTLIYSLCELRETITELFGTNIVSTDPMRLVTEPFSRPQMFLYSEADIFIPSNDVEKFARQRAKRGVRSQLVLFKDSPHLKHMSMYRDIYVSAISRFMKECLAERTDENSDPVHKENVDLPYLSKRVILPREPSHQVQ